MRYREGNLIFVNKREGGQLKKVLIHCDRSTFGEVVIPNGVNKIEAGAFEGCKDVTCIHITNSVTEVGDRAFAESGIVSLSLPKLEHIQFRLCAGCKSLKTVIIQEGLISIDAKAFEQCEALESLGIKADKKGLILPMGFEALGDSAFRFCVKLETAEFPSSVTTINYAAFSCSGLKAIHYPQGTTIGYLAFDRCSNLNKVIDSESSINYSVGF